jgi:mgtE-like transporter
MASRWPRIFLQGLPFLALAALIELGGGLLLRDYLNFIELVPGVLILLPALTNLRGAVSGAMAARLGTAHTLGLVTATRGTPEVWENVKASLALALIASVASGLFAFAVAGALGLRAVGLPALLALSVGAGLVGSAVMTAFTVWAVRVSLRHRLDPDNVTIPLLTAVGDVVMIASLYAFVRLFSELMVA